MGAANAQVKLLQRKFEAVLGEEGRHLVDVNTIDGFQAGHPCRAPTLQISNKGCCPHARHAHANAQLG